jgi:hypothetical protein
VPSFCVCQSVTAKDLWLNEEKMHVNLNKRNALLCIRQLSFCLDSVLVC